jgi:inosine/xanthosine triphosphatase
MAEAAPAPLQVVVGSKNPVKLAAVRQAFFRAFPDRYIAFAGRDVPSGVRDQPWGHEETWKGATQRARGALLAETGADYAVGIEGGVVQAGDGLRSVAYVAIRRSRDMRGSLEHTASFKLPPRVARLLFGQEPGHGKLEMGAACDLVFNETNSKQQGGTVGALTRGVIDRTAYYEQTVVCALAPFLHDDSGLYDSTTAAAPPAPAPVPVAPAPAPAPAPVAPPAAPPPAAPPDDDSDFELVAVLSPEQRSAESRKRAERDGDVIDLSDLADDAVGQDPATFPPAAAADRARMIRLHMHLLEHAAGCRNAACPSANCRKMKNLLRHGATCTTKVQGGCAICRRVWALLQIHARQCAKPAGSCPVPKCAQLKAQLAQMQQRAAGPAPAAPPPPPPPPRPAGPAPAPAAKRARAAPPPRRSKKRRELPENFSDLGNVNPTWP